MHSLIGDQLSEKQGELASTQRSFEQVLARMKAQRQSVSDKIRNTGEQVVFKRNDLLSQLQQLGSLYSAANLPAPMAFTLTDMPDDTTQVRINSLLGHVRCATAHGTHITHDYTYRYL